jgi:thioredoxin-like negative regulator of GroEL
VVLFVKNEPINKFMGFMTRDAICQWIKKNTASLS